MTWRTITKGSKAEADAGLDELDALGIRQMVPTDKFDNAFSGTKGNDGFNGVATNLGNFAQNGSFLDIKPCAPGAPSDNPQLSADAIPQQDFAGLLTTLFGQLANLNPLPLKLPLYGAAPHCHLRDFTEMGNYRLQQMVKRNLTFDVDHMSAKGRDGALDELEKLKYSGVISSHAWADPTALPRVYRLRGMVNPYAASPSYADKPATSPRSTPVKATTSKAGSDRADADSALPDTGGPGIDTVLAGLLALLLGLTLLANAYRFNRERLAVAAHGSTGRCRQIRSHPPVRLCPRTISERELDFATIEMLHAKHPAWRLLRARNAPLILSFLGAHFIDANSGATPASLLASALDEHLYAVDRMTDDPRFANDPAAYLVDWSAPESGWLRAFYPPASDEVHYDATADLEKAYAWVSGLAARSFVGTESRLHTIVDLLRQIVHGAEPDPELRLAELRRRREQINREIAEAENGNIVMLDETALRDRYQQFSSTARELLSDFREVEENFRALDRTAREKIAAWDGSKGDLLTQLVGNRSDITSSDQGRSFQAFYDFLLSQSRQDELSSLLATVENVDAIHADRRLRTIHHDWSDAAERTQHTVRQLSEQLRRFLDDQVWLENRRVLDLVRSIEVHAIELRDDRPTCGLVVDVPGIDIMLPFERPLYDARPPTRVESTITDSGEQSVDMSTLFNQTFVDQARLADNIRAVVPARSTAMLSDIISFYPVDEGVAEIIGYLALSDEDIEIAMDDSDDMHIDYADADGSPKRLRLPLVTVSRR